MKDILIIDFYDSFTFNIVAELDQLGFKSRVIAFDQLGADLDPAYYSAIIFGPGPGHPQEYKSVHGYAKNWCVDPQIPTMGICLGHQLFWHVKGAKIQPAQKIIHGAQDQLIVNQEWKKYLKLDCDTLSLQRYNSLAVSVDSLVGLTHKEDLLWQKGSDLMASYLPLSNHISYQFHPESVGTSCGRYFFETLSNTMI